MTKRSFTALFLFAATILNILLTVIIILALVVATTFVIRMATKGAENETLFSQIVLIDWMICFAGGVVLDMFLYSKITMKVITAFNLETKLDPHLLGRKFETKGKAQSQKEEKPKTVMPKSVQWEEEADTWGAKMPNDNSGNSDL